MVRLCTYYYFYIYTLDSYTKILLFVSIIMFSLNSAILYNHVYTYMHMYVCARVCVYFIYYKALYSLVGNLNISHGRDNHGAAGTYIHTYMYIIYIHGRVIHVKMHRLFSGCVNSVHNVNIYVDISFVSAGYVLCVCS